MKFHTLTLQIQKKANGKYLKSVSNFRSLFKTFIYQNQQDDKSEFKSLQYNKYATESDAYYIFVSNSEDFLKSVKLEMQKLISRAEDNQKETMIISIKQGFISNNDLQAIDN
jgi:hypothetical protein